MFPWIPFVLYAVINAATPGPNAVAAMSNAVRLGFRRTLPFSLGIWVGFSVVAVLCALLCDTLQTLLPVAQKPMLILGAAYILYLAWKLWNAGEIASDTSARSGFLGGFLLPFVNPKVYIYVIVSMQAYVLSAFHGQTLMLLALALFLAFVSFAMNVVWAAFGAALRVVFSRYAHIINRALALALAWCAISLFF